MSFIYAPYSRMTSSGLTTLPREILTFSHRFAKNHTVTRAASIRLFDRYNALIVEKLIPEPRVKEDVASYAPCRRSYQSTGSQ